jgi:hypothetical protein
MTKMLLAGDNDVIRAISPDRTDDGVSILPGRRWCNGPIPDAHGSKTPDVGTAERAVAITNDVLWPFASTAGFGQLTGNPFSAAGNAAGQETHTRAETKLSEQQTGLSTRRHQHDCQGRSSSLATVAAFSLPCILLLPLADPTQMVGSCCCARPIASGSAPMPPCPAPLPPAASGLRSRSGGSPADKRVRAIEGRQNAEWPGYGPDTPVAGWRRRTRQPRRSSRTTAASSRT